MPSRDWYSFDLTPAGIEAVRSGSVARRITAERQSGNTFRILLRQAFREEELFNTSFAVLSITFENRESLRAKSERLWQQTRLLTYEVVNGCLRSVDVAAETPSGLLLLLPHANERDVERLIEDIRRRLDAVLAENPGAAFSVVERSALTSLVADGS
jgi:hypothetical protein